MRARLAADEGTTLAEVLVTIVVLATGFVTILAGLTTTMRTTDLHHQQSRGEAIVREYAEAVDAAPYVSCAADYPTAYAAPTGWTASVTSIAYWDRSSKAFGSTCASGSVQLVSLSVRHGTDVTESLQVVKRQR